MLVENIATESRLYETLRDLGVLATEEKRIRDARANIDETRAEVRRLWHSDILGTSYLHPHFQMEYCDLDTIELWIGGSYVYRDQVTWISDDYHQFWFGVLDRDYEDGTVVEIIHNWNIFRRYTTVRDEIGAYEHSETVSLTDQSMRNHPKPTQCCYCVVDGVLTVPAVSVSGDSITFTCHYNKSVDMVCCANLVGTYVAAANEGIAIDSVDSHRTYLHIQVDFDDNYPIDARFYPYVCVDKDCVLRVYNDASLLVPHPESTRLMAYPEFFDVGDPYNTDNAYLSKVSTVDDIISGGESEEDMLVKFRAISAYCYRVWDNVPCYCDEQSDFIVRDNSVFGRPTFAPVTVARLDGTSDVRIVSDVPCEDHRDVLWYNGFIFYDYETLKLRLVGDHYVEAANGTPRYVIPEGYVADGFTVVKFNAAEDTQFVNIGDCVNEELLVKFHHRLNRFYRNMVVMRGQVLGEPTDSDDAVRVGTTVPETKDDHLWFELLVNTDPDEFLSDPIEQIDLAGLSSSDVPDSIKRGAYSIDLDPDDGPSSYSQLLITYFELSEKEKDYLVLQTDENQENLELHYDEVGIGDLPENARTNDIVLQSIDGSNDTSNVSTILTGAGEPFGSGFNVGDLYVERQDTENLPEMSENNSIVVPDEFQLDDLRFFDTPEGRLQAIIVIDGLSVDEKVNLVTSYIIEGTDAEKEEIRTRWESYLTTMDEETLNDVVYRVLMTDYIYTTMKGTGSGADTIAEQARQLLIVDDDMPLDTDIGTLWLDVPEEKLAPLFYEIRKINISFILDKAEPKDVVDGDLWIDCAPIPLQDYINDYITSSIHEDYYDLPEATYHKVGDTEYGTLTFDYGAHGTDDEIELFRPVESDLREIHYGDAPENPENGDIWYEFLDQVDSQVCYADTDTMVLRIDERLFMVRFEHDNTTAFVFDDMLLNFRGTLGIKYLSVLADLINSGEIGLEDTNIFYRRLITSRDTFDPGLRRLYTGTSFVVSTVRSKVEDYAIWFSSNIGRLRFDYTDPGVTNREREAAWRQVIDYSGRDVGFIGERMMLFVNGRYIARDHYREISGGKIQLIDFPEIIDCVDILYSKRDLWIARAKHIVLEHWWYVEDTSVPVQRPERDYLRMEPVVETGSTKLGYYDVLLDEFILNGRLERMLRYLADHPDEFDQFRLDMVRRFHAISDVGLVGMTDDISRIVIPCLSAGGKSTYTIE